MATFQSHSIAKWNLLRFLENPSGQAFKVTEPWRLLDLASKEIAHFFSESRKLSARTACLAFQVPDRVVRYPKARARATAISRTDRYKNLIRHQHGSYIRTQVSVETNVLSFQSVHVTCGGGTRCMRKRGRSAKHVWVPFVGDPTPSSLDGRLTIPLQSKRTLVISGRPRCQDQALV